MTLLALQRSFRAELIHDDEGPPPSSAGLAIYRNAYRARLLDTLCAAFERTRRWVGEETFGVAACHYALSHPPRSWTLDLYGAELPETLAQLFPHDPEVAELAWLEWRMQQAFAAPDRPELDPQVLLTAGLSATDWGGLRFTMTAGFAARAVIGDCAAVWRLASAEAAPEAAIAIGTTRQLVVWRHALVPRFRVVDLDEFAVLGRIAAGETLAGAAGDPAADPARLGGWLTGWLREGLFSGYAVASPSS